MYVYMKLKHIIEHMQVKHITVQQRVTNYQKICRNGNIITTVQYIDMDISILSFSGAGDVWFSLNGTTYQNNSLVTLEDIGDNDTAALLCMTNLTACCRPPNTNLSLGNWLFPNGTRVPSNNVSSDFYRDRDQMVVRMKRRRDGEEGIYRCEIPDSVNVTQTIYIGVYNTSTGEV